MNEKVYIHEFIDIIGHQRANYMHHMTANWSPNAQEDRHQLCYGVWGILGTTRGWPEVLNMWEEDGFDGLASSFRLETGGAGMQDPKLAKWWSVAADFRRHGDDRILVPKPWTRTIEELCADGVRGEAYAHEQVHVPMGTSGDYLERVADTLQPLYREHGWELAGAWETAMVNESECFLLWAIPQWEQWASFEQAALADSTLRHEQRSLTERITGFHRFLLMDAPLCPFRTGRQPSRDDRTGWEE
jgi:hypothetical protein